MLLGCVEVMERSPGGHCDLRGFLLINSFSKGQLETLQGERVRALSVLSDLKGCFMNGFSSGHSLFGSSSYWLGKLQVRFSSTRAVNL